jgi:hypothetical protein
MNKRLRFLSALFVLCILAGFCIAASRPGGAAGSDGNVISDGNGLPDGNSIYPPGIGNIPAPDGSDTNVLVDGNVPKLIGGDKDEHGCLIAAGYSWCEQKQKCLRVWEEPCTGSNASDANTGNQLADANGSNVIPAPANPIVLPATAAVIQNRVEAQRAFENQAVTAFANETRTAISEEPVVFSPQSAATVESNPKVAFVIAQARADAKVQIVGPLALSSGTLESSPQPVAITKMMVIENVRENDANVEKVVSRFVLSTFNNSAERIYDVKLVEVVPKEVALSASKITSAYDFNVLEADPVIEFIIPLVEPGQTVNVDYSVDGNLAGADLSASGAPVVLFLREADLAPAAGTPTVSDQNLPPDKNVAVVPSSTQPTFPIEIMGAALAGVVIIILIIIVVLRKRKPKADVQVPPAASLEQAAPPLSPSAPPAQDVPLYTPPAPKAPIVQEPLPPAEPAPSSPLPPEQGFVPPLA